jgi:hypothetical protein
MHKDASKKILLSRETLRQLSTGRLEAVAGGVFTHTRPCGSVCITNCHTCGTT